MLGKLLRNDNFPNLTKGDSMKFKNGDIVVLRSGGALMTVDTNRPGADNYIECRWFVGDVFNEQTFHEDAIVIFPIGNQLPAQG